ncbi:FAD/NAD(P)-binding domain-containing protein [Desulfonema limicola]|uniref:FAD/NAD(P)-binding domain-containing protein n=1 Tax=Desulfonema limicola TaxID=45656 RepID=A0A975B8Q5_9BACT|nr:hypothetical protein [Desulfonema limicola]QTA81049.1 FAD/NAD(P)-binding domain-containing protein [Desulfonema limicola]
MNNQLQKSTVLQENSKVAIIGGGPAGAFFAIQLLDQAKQACKNISVIIIEKKGFLKSGNTRCMLKGCNYCAGEISPQLHKALLELNITLPRELICQEFTHIWFHSLWKNFPLKIPPGQKMYSIFRGTLPPGRSDIEQGFDNFILQKAIKQGAEAVFGEAVNIKYNALGKPLLSVKKPSGDIYTIESDFTAICTGINSKNNFFQSYKKINPQFIQPKTRPALIFELNPGQDYLKKYMDKEIYFIKSGSKDLQLEYIALIPKGKWLTVAIIGKSIDRASSSRDIDKIIKAFFFIPSIKTILPHMTHKNTPVSCICTPYMAIKPAKQPFSNKTAMTGDALGARLYRDGLYSAFISGQKLAETVINTGTDKQSLLQGYGPVIQWLKKDNFFGILIFEITRIVLNSPILSRILYQAFATEMKFKQTQKWYLGNLFLKTATGAADYQAVLLKFISAPVIRSILTGTCKTGRNILTELFFNIKWEDYGRYPTVIIKEKRDYIKKSIAAHLGINLDHTPEMERMYAIKIRASSEVIFQELGRFGDVKGKFLRLRFVDVKRISGKPNQEGAVVSYCAKNLPVSMDIRLKRSIPGQTLFYEPEELFAVNGKLIFEIRPTIDGNNRLVIYTGFDFKKGDNIVSRIFWKYFKKFFPEYAHDVVWNHAICCIKGEAEKHNP